MTDSDPLYFWRLATDLSVVNAAILIAGQDPSDYAELRCVSSRAVRQNSCSEEGEWVYFEDATGESRPLGYDAAFSALKNAIMKGRLEARIARNPTRYRSAAASNTPPSEAHTVDADEEIESSTGTGSSLLPGDTEYDVHWGLTLVDVEDLKAWLRDRGFRTGFFFPAVEADPDDFLDPAHDHYSPELALAVKAWNALTGKKSFPQGVKAAILKWIEDNPDAWEGEKPISEKGKTRVVDIVNWNTTGGAPQSKAG